MPDRDRDDSPPPNTPPMPSSRAEWAAHWAFYRLAIRERDAARRLHDEPVRPDIHRQAVARAEAAEARVRELEAAARAVVEAEAALLRTPTLGQVDTSEAAIEALARLLDAEHYEPVRPDIHRQTVLRAEAAEARVQELEAERDHYRRPDD
jgi:hypothetical protein